MSTTQRVGLMAIATAMAVSTVALPAKAQQRVCVQSETTGRVVCGRLVNTPYGYDNDRYDNDRYNNDRYNNDRYNNDRYNDRTSNRSYAGFDERFYLTAYPDVATAVRNRQIRDAYTHYTQFGRFEGRLPRFSESSYLSKNPDVADAVRRGKIRNGYDHWLRYGRYENRKI